MLNPNDSSQASNSESPVTTSLQPMGFTDILDSIFSLYRNNFQLFLRICAVYFVFNCVLSLMAGIVPLLLLSSSGLSMMEAILGLVFAILVLVVLVLGIVATFVVTLFAVGGLTFASAQTYLGRHISARTAFRQVKRRFWPFLGGHLLWMLVVGALTITIIGIPFAIYFGTRWVFWSLAVLVEEHSVTNALRRSGELVKGTWWRVFGIMLGILLLAFMIQSILQFSLLFVFGVSQSTGGEGDLLTTLKQMFLPELTAWAGLVRFAVQNVINNLVASLMLPVYLIGAVLLYYDSRIRKEGFDIEMRVSNDVV